MRFKPGSCESRDCKPSNNEFRIPPHNNLKLRAAVLFLLPAFALFAVPASSQSIGGEIYRFASSSTNTPPGTASINAAVPAGATVVLLAAEDGNDFQISGVADSKGNHYAQMSFYRNTGFETSNIAVWAGYAAKGLTPSDTITITWSPAPSSYRSYGISIVYLTGVRPASQPDFSARNNAYMPDNRVSIPGTTREPKTIAVGMLLANDFIWSIGNGTIYDRQPVNIHYNWFYKVLTAPGPYDPAGTGAKANTYAGVWVSFAADRGSNSRLAPIPKR